MSAMQIDEMVQKNAKLLELIADKQNLSNIEKEVEEEERLSRGSKRSMAANTDNAVPIFTRKITPNALPIDTNSV